MWPFLSIHTLSDEELDIPDTMVCVVNLIRGKRFTLSGFLVATRATQSKLYSSPKRHLYKATLSKHPSRKPCTANPPIPLTTLLRIKISKQAAIQLESSSDIGTKTWRIYRVITICSIHNHHYHCLLLILTQLRWLFLLLTTAFLTCNFTLSIERHTLITQQDYCTKGDQGNCDVSLPNILTRKCTMIAFFFFAISLSLLLFSLSLFFSVAVTSISPWANQSKTSVFWLCFGQINMRHAQSEVTVSQSEIY